MYARTVPSGPKLSGEHAARERECPACEPRLRPPTFLHNTRTLPPSLSLCHPKRPASRYSRLCLTPFSLRPRPPPLTYLESATSTRPLSRPHLSPFLPSPPIIPDFCRLTEIQTELEFSSVCRAIAFFRMVEARAAFFNRQLLPRLLSFISVRD